MSESHWAPGCRPALEACFQAFLALGVGPTGTDIEGPSNGAALCSSSEAVNGIYGLETR